MLNSLIEQTPQLNKAITLHAHNFHPHAFNSMRGEIKKGITHKQFVKIAIRFHRWASRDELFETRSHLYIFRQTIFSKSNSSIVVKQL